MFGAPNLGKHVGKYLGSGIGSLFGSGDYQMTGPTPENNVLSGTVPQFKTSHATNVVSHREYLGDIYSTTAFNNTTYPIQPGVNATFPWLAAVASSYQQFRIQGMVFEFNPMTTDYANAGQPGYLIMATNYNSDVPAYTTKQQMENSEFAVSVKPTCKLMHMVECKPSQVSVDLLYTRTSTPPVGQDLRLYDLGLFQIATGGASSAGVNLGELWVTYTVEFFKPVLPATASNVGNSSLYQGVVISSGVFTNTSPSPTIRVGVVLGAQFIYDGTNNIINLYPTPGVAGLYYITFSTPASSASSATGSLGFPSGVSGYNAFGGAGYQSFVSNGTTWFNFSWTLSVNASYGTAPVTVTFNASNTNWASGSNGTLFITKIQ
jgi:hypothetical protein